METLTLDFYIIKVYISPETNQKTYTLVDLRYDGMPPGYRVFDISAAEFEALEKDFNIL